VKGNGTLPIKPKPAEGQKSQLGKISEKRGKGLMGDYFAELNEWGSPGVL